MTMATLSTTHNRRQTALRSAFWTRALGSEPNRRLESAWYHIGGPLEAIADVHDVAAGRTVRLELWVALDRSGAGAQPLPLNNTAVVNVDGASFTATKTEHDALLVIEAHGSATPDGYEYVQVRIETDNPKGTELVSGLLRRYGTPAD
jgi:hypothetical protein